jgi:hypothetical protein
MKERPILFKGEMVRAILEGRKTQTRRIVKPQPRRVDGGVPFGDAPAWAHAEPGSMMMRCPHGKLGDRLWVKENWATSHHCDHLKPREIDSDWRIHYAADGQIGGLLKRSNIHMPRWASRITLEITGVRVERLQDISEADAKAEGVESLHDQFCVVEKWLPKTWETGDCGSNKFIFATLWQSINGDGSWDANPFVWVVEFRRLT